MHNPDPAVGGRQLANEVGFVSRFPGETVQVLHRPLQDQAPRVRGARKVLNRIVDLEDEGVRELAEVVEPRLRTAPVRLGNPGLPCGDDDAADERQEHDRCSGDHGSMTANELAGLVPPRAPLRNHRKTAQVTADVFGKLFHRSVPSLRFLPQRLQQDEVEVAAQLSRQPWRWRLFRGRVPLGAPHRSARPFGLLARDGCGQLATGAALEAVGSATREEPIEHHSKRVHVAGGRHRLATDLLGAGVLRRERPQHRLCHVADGIQQRRDTEVQQLRDPVTGHEDVGGLDVAMNHQALMRVLDRRADTEKQLQALSDRRPVRATELVDRRAVDELHHEIRDAAVGGAAVEEARDVRVIQTRENLALPAEALNDSGRVESRAHQLQRDLLLVLAIGANGREHFAHAAATELRNDVVRPDPMAHAGGRVCMQQVRRDSRAHGRHFQKACARELVGSQQRPDLATKLRIVAARRCEVRRALVIPKGHGGRQNVLDLPPALRSHLDATPWSLLYRLWNCSAYQIFTRSAGARKSLSPGCRLNAA